jgi:hypothetical protein
LNIAGDLFPDTEIIIEREGVDELTMKFFKDLEDCNDT